MAGVPSFKVSLVVCSVSAGFVAIGEAGNEVDDEVGDSGVEGAAGGEGVGGMLVVLPTSIEQAASDSSETTGATWRRRRKRGSSGRACWFLERGAASPSFLRISGSSAEASESK